MRHLKEAAILLFTIAIPCVQLLASEQSSEQFWLIDARRASTSCDHSTLVDQFDFSYLDDCNWQSSSGEKFFESSCPDVPTGVYVHGNRTDLCKAISDGYYVYNYMKRRAQGRPFRFVLWAWPSTKTCGPRRDAQIKSHRCDTQGLFLAHFFDKAGQKTSVCAIGHSFGAKIIANALHLVGGGQVAGKVLTCQARERKQPLQAVLVAAAMEAGALLPNHRNGLALTGVDRLIITCNRYDRVLKWYPLTMMRGSRKPALGRVGPMCLGQLGNQRHKIDLINTSCSVGKTHDWSRYIRSATLRNRMATYFFPDREEEN